MSQASGILNVNKPAGPSSFDIVRLVRRGTAVKKAGHAGTLDPLASGVLLVLLGQAVRISEYLMDLPKTYRATVRFGFATDTYDAEGTPAGAERAVEGKHEEVESTLEALVGEMEKTPR